MSAIRSSCLALVACGFLVAGVGVAQEKKKENESKEHATAKDVLGKAKIDLAKAIQTAQAKVPGGKPMQASVEEENGKHIFEVHFLMGDKVKSVEVDAVTGEASNAKDDEDESPEDIAEAKEVLGVSKIAFAQAITTAKAQVSDGKPFEISLQAEKDKSIIDVELLSGNKVMVVEIDAISGKVLSTHEEKED